MVFRLFRSRARADPATPRPEDEIVDLDHDLDRDLDRDLEDVPPPEAVELEISDTLDLHFFPPRDVKDLVEHWLGCAYDAGHREVRIVHGKGKGVQRRMVRSILERDPRVIEFGDAPDASSWGATRATLRS